MRFKHEKERMIAAGSIAIIGIIAHRYFETEFSAWVPLNHNNYPFLLLIFLGISSVLLIKGYQNQATIKPKNYHVTESMSANQLLDEIKRLKKIVYHEPTLQTTSNTTTTTTTTATTSSMTKESIENHVVDCLQALSKKFSPQRKGVANTNEMEALSLLSQEAAYDALLTFPSSDAIISSALSVLAIISGDTQVRQRTRDDVDTYGVHWPISIIQSSLERAKNVENPTEEGEQLSALVQSKGCLFLGAIADGDAEISKSVVEQDGLYTILDACDWYRVHSEVAKWSLWAIFVLCYDSPGNKVYLLHADGITKICQTLRELIDNVDVTRHGVAILFDSLRENGIAGNIDVGKLRLMALNAGLHHILQQAMAKHPDSEEITLMGQQMLQATGG